MNESASMLHDGENIKLVIRHSLRPRLKGVKKHEDVRITPEGEALARDFGESIQYTIGELHSSMIPRCIQTLEYIMDNRPEKRIIIESPNILTDVFAIDRKVADVSFKEIGSLKKIVKKLLDNDNIPGFRTLNDCVTLLLDYIFETGNVKNQLDLYCTHDLQLAMLYCALYCPNASLDNIESNWSSMLEGMFFCGKRDDFLCLWRGQVKRFTDFMTM